MQITTRLICIYAPEREYNFQRRWVSPFWPGSFQLIKWRRGGSQYIVVGRTVKFLYSLRKEQKKKLKLRWFLPQELLVASLFCTHVSNERRTQRQLCSAQLCLGQKIQQAMTLGEPKQFVSKRSASCAYQVSRESFLLGNKHSDANMMSLFFIPTFWTWVSQTQTSNAIHYALKFWHFWSVVYKIKSLEP